ncbi:MAG: alpha/beta fold hydrolase [Actinobacteria bacterium]|nr:alpha/beta fold hydrolase [Actinomycetota bacterium]
MAYVDVGEGPAVVFLHGFPTSSHLWRHFLPAVWTAGMRGVAVDLLGYGASEKPDGPRLDVRAQAGYVAELLAGLGIDRFAVVGHDLGGAVAQLLALDGAGVRAMVLLDAAAFDGWPIEGVRMLQDARAEEETPELVAGVMDLTFELGIAREERRPEELLATYRRAFAGPEGAAAFFRAVRAIDGRGLVGREGDLAALDVPALIAWGEEDPFLPVELADRLNEAMPMSSLALLPGCSHFLPEDASETLAPMVGEWLRVRYLGRGHDHGGEAGGGPVPVELRRRPGDDR